MSNGRARCRAVPESRAGASRLVGELVRGFARGLALALALQWLSLPARAADVPAPADASQARAQPEAATGSLERQLVFGAHTMVVTANRLASDAAASVLRRGGGALDAAIAAQMVLALVEPQSSGIGGGGFLLHYAASERKVRVYDGRETAPAAATERLMLGEDGRRLPFFAAVDSGISVGVPGLLRMLEQAHRRHGRLAWRELFQPAIALARDGFVVSARLAGLVEWAKSRIARSAAANWLMPGGRPVETGARLRNPALALSFEAIAAGGADAFYRGEIARHIVSAVRSDPRRGGQMTLDDLAGYRAIEREPVCGVYRRIRVCGAPAPSSGGITLLQTLGILSHFDLRAMRPDPGRSTGPAAVHLITEAMRLAYADRAAFIADPAYVDIPWQGLLDPGYLSRRAALIDPGRAMGAAVAGRPPGLSTPVAQDGSRPLPSTTHLSIVDARGDAVSMTSSIEHAFGSLVFVDGFLLNNQLTDFAFEPTDSNGRPVANRVGPGKRPRSTMAPTILLAEDGRLVGALGSPGGSAIVAYVARTLVEMLDWDRDAQRAIDAPNFGARAGATTYLERDNAAMAGVAPSLVDMGHPIRFAAMVSGLHALMASPGPGAGSQTRPGWVGAADRRREGLAVAD